MNKINKMNKISKKYGLWFGVAALAGCTSVADMVGYDTAAWIRISSATLVYQWLEQIQE